MAVKMSKTIALEQQKKAAFEEAWLNTTTMCCSRRD